MARRSSEPDFIEALARGLDVLQAFEPRQPVLPMAEIATRAQLARPTARRILLTLIELGYVRAQDGGFTLTPKVLDLGSVFVQSLGLWEIARPHMEQLVSRTNESTSIAQLDGSDIVYVARAAVPKIVGLAVSIGTRFPALQTSLGKILLAAMTPEELEETLAIPSRSGVTPRWNPTVAERDAELRDVRAKGWALTDQALTLGIRSIAAPLRDGAGQVVAAVNVNANAAETEIEVLVDHHLPLLLHTAAAISADWAKLSALPLSITAGTAGASVPA
jgi:IclR family pca regulon transcriptional regulator